MEVVLLLDGASGLQAHILFKEEDGNHIDHVYIFDIFEYMVYLDIYISLAI